MIVDTHVHVGNKLDFSMPPETVLASMKKYKIDYSLVSSIDSTEADHLQRILPRELQTPQEESLEILLDFVKKNPDKIGAAVWVKPATEKLSKNFKKLILDNRDYIFAVKFHPFHSNVFFGGEETKAYIEFAGDCGLPVVTHTAATYESHPRRVYETAKKYPSVNFVMVHLGLGTDNKEAISLAAECKNLYGDTTWVPVENTLEFIKKAGIEKIFFGSDSPIDGLDTYHHNRKGEKSIYQDYFNKLPLLLGKEEYDMLMWKNAVDFFGLPLKK